MVCEHPGRIESSRTASAREEGGFMNLTNKRFLVIGGAGFIGSHVVDQLLGRYEDSGGPIAPRLRRVVQVALDRPRILHRLWPSPGLQGFLYFIPPPNPGPTISRSTADSFRRRQPDA